MILKHKWVAYIIYVAAAFIGAFAVALLNNSSLAQNGYGLELPMGWAQETVENTDNLPACGLTNMFSSTCFSYTCDTIEWKSEGLPLSTRRMGTCREQTNTFAAVMNLVIGATVGFVFARWLVRRLSAKVE